MFQKQKILKYLKLILSWVFKKWLEEMAEKHKEDFAKQGFLSGFNFATSLPTDDATDDELETEFNQWYKVTMI